MTEPRFFNQSSGLSLADVAALTGASLRDPSRNDVVISGIAPLDRAGPSDLTFADREKFLPALQQTRACACFVTERLAPHVPARVIALIVKRPHSAFVAAARALYPDALRPSSLFGGAGIAPGAIIHPSARMESGVIVDPGAVIGPGAEIGSGTVISAQATIGADVRIGRDCVVGAGATVTHALIGDRVTIHPGSRIGQDGFGYLGSAAGHQKIPQIGRVIIQNDVEIGANAAIDRGAMGDTVIGEGSKIDNLVQIGHNVSVGRHCIIVSQTGVSGSCVLEDFVVLGGQVGLADHLTIGEGAQVAAQSGVIGDVPAGGRYGGYPARPMREWLRSVAAANRSANRTPPLKDTRHD